MSDPAVELPKLGTCNFTALRMASRRVSQLYDAALAPAGIKTTQMSVLAALEHMKQAPPTINALAALLVMDRSTLGQNLRPLERDGLVRIATDPDDGRVRRATLTVAGRATLRQGAALWKTAQQQFEARYGSAMAADLRGMLMRIAMDRRDETD